MKELDDRDIIRKQEAAIETVLEYIPMQIEVLTLLNREAGRAIDYLELMKTILENVKNPDREAETQAILEKVLKIR